MHGNNTVGSVHVRIATVHPVASEIFSVRRIVGAFAMTLKVEKFAEPILLLRAEGRINALRADNFYAQALMAIATSDHDVIMDSAEIVYISSAGLRAVLHISRALQAEKRSLHICSLRPHIEETFKIIGFHKIVPLHPDIESAMAAVRGDGE